MEIFLSTSHLSHTEEGVQEPDNLLLQPRPQGLLGILKKLGAESARRTWQTAGLVSPKLLEILIETTVDDWPILWSRDLLFSRVFYVQMALPSVTQSCQSPKPTPEVGAICLPGFVTCPVGDGTTINFLRGHLSLVECLIIDFKDFIEKVAPSSVPGCWSGFKPQWGGGLPEVGVYGLFLETLTLFQPQICNFTYPISVQKFDTLFHTRSLSYFVCINI